MQNRRIRTRSAKKPLWQKAIISLFALVVLFGGAGAAYVMNMGGVSKIVEARIAVLSGAAKVSVGGAKLGFRSSLIPVFVRVSDVGMSLADTDLVIPQADIMFGLNSFLTGGPTEIAINGLELDIGRSEDGWSASPLAVFLFDIMQNASASNRDSASTKNNAGTMTGAQSMMKAGLERLTVRANRLSLVHQNDNVAPLVFTNAVISLTADPETGIGGYVTVNRSLVDVDMPADQAAGNIKIDFVGWPVGDEFLVDMTVNKVATNGLAAYFDQLPKAIDGMGIVTGAASVALNHAEIVRMDAAMKMADGMIKMPGTADEAGFESAMLDASYRRDADLLSVATVQLNLADGREFAFSGDVVNFHTPRPNIVGALGINRMPLATLEQEWPIAAAPEAKAALFNRFSGGALQNILFDFVGGYDVATGQLSVSKMDVEAAYSGVRMNLATGQYRRIVGTVDGAINLKIGAGGQVQSMGFGMQLGSGSLLVEGFESTIGLDSVAIKAEMENSVFSLSQFDVALADGASLQIGGDVMLAPDWSPQGLSMSMATKRMRLGLFHALWPDWAKKPVRNWVKTSIPEGLIQDAVLGFDVVYFKDVPRLRNLKGALTLANAKLALSQKMPPMENVYAKLNIEDDAATIILNQANIKDLALQYGRVTIAPLFNDTKPQADMRLSMKGGLSTAVEVGRGFGVGKVGVFDLETIQPEGEIEITFNANFPLGAVVPQDQVDITAAATISDGSFQNLPYGMTVENGELVANVAKDVVEITGTADVSGVPSDFSFRSDAINDKVSFIGKMVPSTVMASSLAALTRFDIGGRVGGSVTMSTDMSFETVRIQLNADMRTASVNVPILSWAKLPAENGHARMTFVLRDGRIDTLQDVDIALGSLSVIGQVLLGQGGAIQGVFLERAKWPGNDLREVMIENSDDGMKIGAQARLIDLSPLRRNSGVGAQRNISFDIVAEQFVVGDGITLSGHLTGNKRKAGGGDALFNGDLLFQGRPLFAESEIKLRFGKSVERLTGTGLVGGAEAEISFVNSENTRPKLIMKSENAGRMLNGLNVTDAIRSGSIVLTNEFVEGNFAEFDTDIKMRDFNVVEAPRAVRAFSVLGPVGLLQLVKGDGTPFEWGEAHFEKRGSSVNITKMRGGGSAVALSLVGRYDTVSRDVEVSGNLVPASLVNQVIGAIPVLGNLLTGVDKGGLFVTQFSMTGSIDDPKTTANAASLIPGVLRDVVSPDWLAREGARILGTDLDAETGSDTESDN